MDFAVGNCGYPRDCRFEQQKADPKVVIGKVDPSVRKCVPLDIMTIVFPMKRFVNVVRFMEGVS
ncbi:MAG: hypothetical protein M0Q92_11035 [Methanoregula sp.]|nr:hypothetical protein [Methanoregula sp.]